MSRTILLALVLYYLLNLREETQKEVLLVLRTHVKDAREHFIQQARKADALLYLLSLQLHELSQLLCKLLFLAVEQGRIFADFNGERK